MIRQYELIERVQAYKPNADEEILNKAYVYAMQKHGKQTRASGDPYFSHPLEVAAILTEMKLDEATIVVALLHDTIEDTSATRAEIDELFGEQIGRLVEGLTKIEQLDLISRKAKQAENLRKLLLAVADDVRVLLVKLADRLHNMRTLDHVPPEKRQRIAEETRDIYGPLAGRMGMQGMREELEALAFKYAHPEHYEMVTKRLAELSEQNKEVIATIEQGLGKLFKDNDLKVEVKSRLKKPYSVFRKMESKSLSFEQLSDLVGFRIIVSDTADCYRALGIIHTRWAVVPGRFKDYISTPKQNDYQSIHTTIVGPSRQRVELQIRSEFMHAIAERGVAAHSLYKDASVESKTPQISEESNAYNWLRRTLDVLSEGDSAEEFLEHTKLELFHDQVFCFTPNGALIALPRGATPIDFAYAVHTDVGNSCVGAKIDGISMPLVTQLSNGDQVEIIRSEKQVPPLAWEKIVTTGKARSAIRKATRTAMRAQYKDLGERILVRAFEKVGKDFSPELLVPTLSKLGHTEVDDIFASIGRGELTSLDVIAAVFPNYKEERKSTGKPTSDGWFNLKSAAGLIFKVPSLSKSAKAKRGRREKILPKSKNAMPIRGMDTDMGVEFGPTGAVPGDRIIGIVQPGKGIVVYPIQAPQLSAFEDEPEKWIDIRWDIDEASENRFPARIIVTVVNEPGVLAKVSSAIASSDANIENLIMVSAADFKEMTFDLMIWDLKQLNQLLAQLKAFPFTSSAERVYE
ncbi:MULTISPECIES: RelA/SpoT family protein [unclassified Lentilitoribacter]|jgi:guanosine-3',5'-bis(diphosphate) 3'-pyrophosphohydrolase|uniref:RelA/SpoT family protein n=1 Tax=unclassified Lentilitoribacter TaxID=2647570 RepID=UPI0013A69185|nr:bifunctional (p)ppGpp synthetase/guanosine-3',5'-bis(diphosphate) 3'-pyrophosphohydrolase [Lentilitoribacter sp. Alg239-R112]